MKLFLQTLAGIELALRCVEFDTYYVAIGSNCVEFHTRFNVNKYITKMYAKMKELGPVGGRAPGTPPRSTNDEHDNSPG